MASEASRTVFWNLEHVANQWVMYGLLMITLLVLGYGIYLRVALWAKGRSDSSRFNLWLERALHLLRQAFLQAGVRRKKIAALFHQSIWLGFLVLLFATTVVFIHHDLGWKIFQGRFYLFVSFFADIFGLLLGFGLSVAAYRRYVHKPSGLHSGRADSVLLLGLALLVVQGFLLEAIRIAETEDPWAWYSPVGALLAIPFEGLSSSLNRNLHFALWWIHTINVFALIAILPYGKLFHALTSSANLFFVNLNRPKGALRYDGDIEEIMEQALESEEDDSFQLGVGSISDLSWKQRLDLDACTSCGRCQDACPAYRTGKPLSPKWLILDLRDHMLQTANGQGSSTAKRVNHWLTSNLLLADSLSVADNNTDKSFRSLENVAVQKAAKGVGLSQEASLAPEVLDENVFWACTTCRACMEACPVGIEHVDLIVDVRRSLTMMESSMPTEAEACLRAIETRGNPFGANENRLDWAEGLEVPIADAGSEVDVLYWVGCISAHDKRKQKIARSVAKILNAANVNWGVLGPRERCTGDPARRLGQEHLFQASAKANIETFNTVQFKTLLCHCPHCFNTFSHEYSQVDPDFGTNFVVRHHSEFISELIKNGTIALNGGLSGRMTFHDACYLGRYNDIYQAPRDICDASGVSEISEMKEHRENSLCCGAGGGHFWMDLPGTERVNVQRIKQAQEVNADTVVSACPFCLHMLEDAVKIEEGRVQIRDIAELAAENLKT